MNIIFPCKEKLTAEQVTQKRRWFRVKRKLKKQKKSIVLGEDKHDSQSKSRINDNSSIIDVVPGITLNATSNVALMPFLMLLVTLILMLFL